MNYKESYQELRYAVKKLVKTLAFEEYSFFDLFYLLDETSKAVVTFADPFMKVNSSISFYFDTNGINYLVDSYTSETGFARNPYVIYKEIIVICPRQGLTLDNLSFLKKHQIRISKDFNIIPYELREGYDPKQPSRKRIDRMTRYLYYLLSLIKNEREEINKYFSEEKIVVAAFDNKKGVYEFQGAVDAIFNQKTILRPAIEDFIREYKNQTYVDDTCYVHHYFTSSHVPNKPYHESVLFCYYEKKDTYIIQSLSCKPEEVKEYVVGFLDDAFKKEGIPLNISFNHRKLYAYLYQTLERLNIEVSFQREMNLVDAKFLDVLSLMEQEKIEGEKKYVS